MKCSKTCKTKYGRWLVISCRWISQTIAFCRLLKFPLCVGQAPTQNSWSYTQFYIYRFMLCSEKYICSIFWGSHSSSNTYTWSWRLLHTTRGFLREYLPGSEPLPDYILIYSQRGPRDGAGYCEQMELRRGVDSILSSAAFIVLYELMYCIVSDFDSIQGQDMYQCCQSMHTWSLQSRA